MSTDFAGFCRMVTLVIDIFAKDFWALNKTKLKHFNFGLFGWANSPHSLVIFQPYTGSIKALTKVENWKKKTKVAQTFQFRPESKSFQITCLISPYRTFQREIFEINWFSARIYLILKQKFLLLTLTRCLLINCLIFSLLSLSRYDQELRKADITDCVYNGDKGYVNLNHFCSINIIINTCRFNV